MFFVFRFLIQYVSNKEGAAKANWLACVNELLLFQTLLYLMRCLTAEMDLLSYFMSCFWLLARLAASGSVQS